MKRPLQLTLIVAFILVGVAVVGIAYYALQSPVPEAKLRQVKLGMSGEAVRKILGAPTSISVVTNEAALGVLGTHGGAQWTYMRDLPGRSVWVYVMFTNDSVTHIGRNRFP